MKNLLLLPIMLVSIYGFSQESKKTNASLPLFLSTINIDNSYLIQKHLNTVSHSVNAIANSQFNIDSNKNRHFIVLSKDTNKTYKLLNISTNYSLNMELDAVMFSGNYFNPNETHFSALNNQTK